MRAVNFFLILAFAALMFCPANALLYELCDSASLDRSTKTLECRITEPKYYFTQQSVDNFWKSVLADQNYSRGKIETVHWLIVSTTINIIEDTAFVKDSDINVAWDITLKGDANMSFEVNWDSNAYEEKEGTVTAIKVTKGSRKPLVLFSPGNGKTTVRNISLLNPSGFLTYIAGTLVRPMRIEIEGDLNIDGASIENAAIVKAKNIYLTGSGSLKTIGKIEANNLSLNNRGKIDTIGAANQIAIELRNSSTGLQLDRYSIINDLLGSIIVDGNIGLNLNSIIKTLTRGTQDNIESVQAKNLTMVDRSEISGIGGTPGTIVLQGGLSMDQNSIISALQGNQIKKIEADSIALTGGSKIQNITGLIKVNRGSLFKLSNGSKIVSLDGNIESCASISLDGNETQIIFLDYNKEIRAPSIDFNNGAGIICIGPAYCTYNFLKKVCASKPSAILEISGSQQGAAPLTIQFNGSCAAPEGIASCKISYGDGNEQEFIGGAMHTYFEAGNYITTLSAIDSSNLTAIATKMISVAAGAGNQPPDNTQPPQSQGTATVEITILPTAVEQGGEVYVEIDSDAEAETFSLQNDAGLPVMTGVPSTFPAKAGPFKTFAVSKPGTYHFTVSGTTKDGRLFSAQAAFEILKKEGAFSFDAFLPLLIVFIIVLVVIVLLARKLIKEGKLGAKKTMLPPGEKPKEGAGKWAWKGPTEEKPQAAQPQQPPAPAQKTVPQTPAPEKPAPITPAAPGELPPWLQGEEEEEEGNGTI